MSMSNDFFSSIPLDLFTPNKKHGIKYLYHLLLRAEKHMANYLSVRRQSKTNHSFSLFTKTQSQYFPSEIQNYICKCSLTKQTLEFKVRERKVFVNVYEMKGVKGTTHFNLDKYLDPLGLWFSLMDLITPKSNVNTTLTVDIYLTSFKKKMPRFGEAFTSSHVNSALTYICNKHGEIIIYREEEWFKVLLHECIHSYCLDFSGADQRLMKSYLFKTFPIQVQDALYSETYAEVWAEIMNCAILSFHQIQKPSHYREFSLYLNFYMQVEIVHSIFQANKILSRYYLSFRQLREKYTQWTQETHVYEYHIMKTILLFSFDKFLIWCHKHNGSDLIPFKNTGTNIMLLCDLIKESFENKDFLSKVKKIETRNNGDKLRMSINEI